MTRQSKTPQQRAEEALGVAHRRVEKYEKAVTAAKATVSVAERHLVTAQRRLTYAQADPDLPQEATEELTSEPAEGGE